RVAGAAGQRREIVAQAPDLGDAGAGVNVIGLMFRPKLGAHQPRDGQRRQQHDDAAAPPQCGMPGPHKQPPLSRPPEIRPPRAAAYLLFLALLMGKPVYFHLSRPFLAHFSRQRTFFLGRPSLPYFSCTSSRFTSSRWLT